MSVEKVPVPDIFKKKWKLTYRIATCSICKDIVTCPLDENLNAAIYKHKWAMHRAEMEAQQERAIEASRAQRAAHAQQIIAEKEEAKLEERIWLPTFPQQVQESPLAKKKTEILKTENTEPKPWRIFNCSRYEDIKALILSETNEIYIFDSVKELRELTNEEKWGSKNEPSI